MKKRNVVLVLIMVAMVLSTFTGCSKSSADEGEEQEKGEKCVISCTMEQSNQLNVRLMLNRYEYTYTYFPGTQHAVYTGTSYDKYEDDIWYGHYTVSDEEFGSGTEITLSLDEDQDGDKYFNPEIIVFKLLEKNGDWYLINTSWDAHVYSASDINEYSYDYYIEEISEGVYSTYYYNRNKDGTDGWAGYSIIDGEYLYGARIVTKVFVDLNFGYR